MDLARGVVIYQCKNLGDSLLTTPLIQAVLASSERGAVTVICKAESIDIFRDVSSRVRCFARPSSIMGWFKLRNVISSSGVMLLPHAAMSAMLLARLAGLRVVAPAGFVGGWGIKPDVSTPQSVTPWRHVAEQHLDLLRKLGILVPKSVKQLSVNIPNLKDLVPEVNGDLPDFYVVVHPGSRWMFKSPSKQFWLAVCNQFWLEKIPVIVTGSDQGAEGELIQFLVDRCPGVAGTAISGTFNNLACVLARATAYLGVDTFVSHLASAVGVPGVVLFGPTSEALWGPYGRSAKLKVVSSRGYTCRPCHIDGCGGGKVSECLDDLDPLVISKLIVDTVYGK